MDYNKLRKNIANENYLRQTGFKKENPSYAEESISIKKSFLIICEGENTEPKYFEYFPVPTNTIITEGGCNSKTSLVNYALEIKDKDRYADREVWCVFDYDLKPDEFLTQPEDFNNAIKKAEAKGMKVAWSNDAFELWFVLHYQQLDSHVTRAELNSILKKQWDLSDYANNAKTQKFCLEHYKRHGGHESEMQKLAIIRAKKLHESFEGRQDFSKHCPCTTVYLLV